MTFDFHNSGYKTTQKTLGSDKSVEILVFKKITGELKAVDRDAPDGFVKLSEALLRNNKLWSIIFLDVTQDTNALPVELKRNLVSLSEFVQKHTLRVLSGEADHDILIKINKSVIAGLSAQTTAVAEAA